MINISRAIIAEWQWTEFEEIFEQKYKEKLGTTNFGDEKLWIEQFRNCCSETLGILNLYHLKTFFRGNFVRAEKFVAVDMKIKDALLLFDETRDDKKNEINQPDVITIGESETRYNINDKYFYIIKM